MPEDQPRDEQGRWASSGASSGASSESKSKSIHQGVTKNGEKFEVFGDHTGSYSVRLGDDLQEIGTAYIATKWSDEGVNQGPADYLSIVRIDPKYQRQGIGTQLYSAIEKHTGKPLRPSPTDQSDAAKGLWAKRSRKDEWNEEDHPRDPDGKFGSGGGGGGDASKGTPTSHTPFKGGKSYSINKLKRPPDPEIPADDPRHTRGLPEGLKFSPLNLQAFERDVAHHIAMGEANPDRAGALKEITAHANAIGDRWAAGTAAYEYGAKIANQEVTPEDDAGLMDPATREATKDRLRVERVHVGDYMVPMARYEEARLADVARVARDRQLAAEAAARHAQPLPNQREFEATGVRSFAPDHVRNPDSASTYHGNTEFSRWARAQGLSGGVHDRQTVAEEGRLNSALERHVVVMGHMNAPLRGSTLSELDRARPKLAADVREMDTLIASQPPLKESVKVYRGVVHGPMTDARAGDVVEDRGYMATSVSREAAQHFTSVPVVDGKTVPHGVRTLVEMTIPAGTQVAVGDHGDGELILGRGQRLEVTEVSPVVDNYRTVKARVLAARKDEWNEEDHPRDPDGKFGSGGGGGGGGGGSSGKPRLLEAPSAKFAASTITSAHSSDNWKPMRVRLEKALADTGMPRGSEHSTEMFVATLPSGVNGSMDSGGRIALAPHTRDRAARFAEAWDRDPEGVKDILAKAPANVLSGDPQTNALIRDIRGMHTIVHENIHAHGPLRDEDWEGPGMAAEEVTTEVATRVFMRDNFNYDVLEVWYASLEGDRTDPPSYHNLIKRTVEAIDEHLGTGPEKGMEILEKAAVAFKRTSRDEFAKAPSASTLLATKIIEAHGDPKFRTRDVRGKLNTSLMSQWKKGLN